MKSIGIITYHHYNNYGTMLQAYALQRVVSILGYNAEIIDFQQDLSMSNAELLKLRIRRLPVYLIRHKKYSTLAAARGKTAKVAEMFETFYRENLIVSKRHYITSSELKEAPPIYDGYLVGSDQTWNPNVSKGPEAFFLTFVRDDKKKGCYAPSIGLSSLTEEQKERYKKYLNGFMFLSCRESIGAQILSDATGKPVEWVLDPTLLLEPKEWNTVSTECSIPKQYILTYLLGDIKEHRQFVRELSKTTGLKVISIPASYLEMQNKEWEQKWVGPDKFLYLIKNAAFMCTDSFHGTAFAINYQIPFFSFCKRKESDGTSDNSRLHSILQMFHMSDRLIVSDKLPEIIDINFTETSRILEEKRKESFAYLKNVLEHFSL
jgi:hypothetical protein